MKAVLALEDGTFFEGTAFGSTGTARGEVVFNTSMTGYQEILTDPSYENQIVTMTYPLIGNYGANDDDFESQAPHVRGFVVREMCQKPSNWRNKSQLGEWLASYGVVGIEGIDTRALTRRLRNQGTMMGVITTEELSPEEYQILATTVKETEEAGLVAKVTTKSPYRLEGPGPRVAVFDLGVKTNILRSLRGLGCDITVLPAFSPAESILSSGFDGVLLSNGPGDPKDVMQVVSEVKKLLGKIPLFGICLGHQILGLALGGDTYKLKFGHRGGNHPVKDCLTGKVYITSQNHGYAVDEKTLPEEVTVSHRNLNDNTVEGLRHKSLSVVSLQYHPEASPGPSDSGHLLTQFIQRLNEGGRS